MVLFQEGGLVYRFGMDVGYTARVGLIAARAYVLGWVQSLCGAFSVCLQALLLVFGETGTVGRCVGAIPVSFPIPPVFSPPSF
eukprot:scaffold1927_cov333-Pavlova_lutheri.AAC.20